MRSLFFVLSAVTVIGLAYWAYHENYRTQRAISQPEHLQREIASQRASLAMLRAEWAYLNRPERLAELADINFDRLGLFPLRPEQFGQIGQVAYPVPEDLFDGLQPVELSARAVDDEMEEAQ